MSLRSTGAAATYPRGGGIAAPESGPLPDPPLLEVRPAELRPELARLAPGTQVLMIWT